jgi:predicted nucleic-acid-binding protein
MTGLDTNVLVRYLTQDDPAQSRKANSLIDGAVRKGRAGQGDFADHVLGLRNRKAGCGATATFDRALKGNTSFAHL